MQNTGNAKIATHKLFDFYIIKRDLTNLFDQFRTTVLFSISFCFYRACFAHLSYSNLSCNLCLWYYDQLFLLNKEINANVYSLWEHYGFLITQNRQLSWQNSTLKNFLNNYEEICLVNFFAEYYRFPETEIFFLKV